MIPKVGDLMKSGYPPPCFPSFQGSVRWSVGQFGCSQQVFLLWVSAGQGPRTGKEAVWGYPVQRGEGWALNPRLAKVLKPPSLTFPGLFLESLVQRPVEQ